MMRHSRLILYGALVVSVGCKREQRQFQGPPHMADIVATVATTDLVPGVPSATQPAAMPKSYYNDLEDNAYQLSEGQRLFQSFNCGTCHAQGGGDIGPPLLDDKWFYGYEPQQVFASIVQGRPNGMPAYGTRLTQQQTWQLVAYVRSMSGLTSKQAAPGRSDDMRTKPPENSVSTTQPRNTTHK